MEFSRKRGVSWVKRGESHVSQRAKSDSRQVFVAPRISGHPLQRTQPTTMPTSSDLKDIAYDQIES